MLPYILYYQEEYLDKRPYNLECKKISNIYFKTVYQYNISIS